MSKRKGKRERNRVVRKSVMWDAGLVRTGVEWSGVEWCGVDWSLTGEMGSEEQSSSETVSPAFFLRPFHSHLSLTISSRKQFDLWTLIYDI